MKKTNYKPKSKFMKDAIDIAKKEHKNSGEWIFGAVIVKNGKNYSKKWE